VWSRWPTSCPVSTTEVGAGTYDFVDTGTIGTDVIKVGFIYKPASRDSESGNYAILDSSVDALASTTL
jgi:predicted extracellular nuclease